MCRLLVNHALCEHCYTQAVACSQLLHRHNDANAAKVSAQVCNPETLGPDFGCDVIRGHVELPRPCPDCNDFKTSPVFFVRSRPLLPPCDPPSWSTDWVPATLCEWYSSFFVDKPHVRGQDDCCDSVRLCSAVNQAHEPGLACKYCVLPSKEVDSWSGMYKQYVPSSYWQAPWVCDGCRVDIHHEFIKARADVCVIRHLGSPIQRRPSLVRRLSSRLKAKLSGKRREASPPPPTRQNTLQWAVQARVQASAARNEQARKEAGGDDDTLI